MMENLPINADTINKAIYVVDESTKETRKEIDKTTAKGVNKLAQLFWASPIGRKADIYIAERPYKMEKELKRMQAKYDRIPAEYQVEPSSYIALKGVNELNYALEEEHLKEMFENILISDMDSRKKSKVLPAYLEIVKQLSKDDAKLLKFIKDNRLSQEAIIKLKINSSPGFLYPSNDIFLITPNGYSLIPCIIIDNLSRLKIIETDFFTYKTDENLYLDVFEKLKSEDPFTGLSNKLGYSKGLLKVTDFGKNFIDICLS